MKNILLFLALSSTILFTSCTGDTGPPGPAGGLVYAKIFEKTVDFQLDNQSGLPTSIIGIPVEVYESDAILVYRLEKQVDINGEVFDAWSQLPQNFFLANGDILQYIFNHTIYDVEIQIDGNFDTSTLIGTNFARNQTFRIAVVPAEYSKANVSMIELLDVMQSTEAEINIIEP